MKIKLGDIFKLKQTNQIVRIIGLDDFEVLYDNYWNHNKSWAFASNLDKKGFFYRMSKEAFLRNASKSNSQELSKEELDVFRIDLPLRFARIKDLSWDSDIFSSTDSLEKLIDSNPEVEKSISANKILICPVGKNGGFKKSSLVESDGENIRISKILVSAKEVRDAINDNSSNGIGLYRLGIEMEIPTYYIGEYIDIAGVMKR